MLAERIKIEDQEAEKLTKAKIRLDQRLFDEKKKPIREQFEQEATNAKQLSNEWITKHPQAAKLREQERQYK